MTSRAGSTIWPVVHQERRVLIDDLEGLEPAQWATPSLCPGWDVHDVLAHLVDTGRTTRLGFLRGVIAAGFDFDKDTAAGVARERTGDPRETLDRFRAVVERKTGPPAPLATRLLEAFLHGEDIRRPLGISRDYPSDHVVTALRSQVTTTRKVGGSRECVEGVRLVATDADFQHGTGPEVRGAVIALLVAVSGRPVGEEELSGPGVAELLARIAA